MIKYEKIEEWLDDNINASRPTMEMLNGDIIIISKSNLGREFVLINKKNNIVEQKDIDYHLWNWGDDICAMIMDSVYEYCDENGIEVKEYESL